ncbi:MAG: YopX family protein [Pseudolactococcus laudensis]
MIQKIRAFDMNIKQMINSIVSIDFEFGYITFEVEGSINRKTYFREVTFMQSTGVYDKHGIEIFKGDIVKIIYDGKLFIGVVVYDLGEADFKATNNHEDYGNNFQYLTVGESIEVIGNIHENPELLEAT